MIYVYMHTAPNGKVYIGQSYNLEERWGNGSGYNTNPAFARDIKKYGWDNIKHEILRECETRSEAIMYELAFTIIKDSENPQRGYNMTHNVEDCIKMLSNPTEYSKCIKEEHERGFVRRNIFIASGLTTKQASDFIDERVFSERDRNLLKSKLIDDLSYEEVAKKYGMSVRQVKKLIADWQDEIKQYL